jgi:hypothetical protein
MLMDCLLLTTVFLLVRSSTRLKRPSPVILILFLLLPSRYITGKLAVSNGNSLLLFDNMLCAFILGKFTTLFRIRAVRTGDMQLL